MSISKRSLGWCIQLCCQKQSWNNELKSQFSTQQIDANMATFPNSWCFMHSCFVPLVICYSLQYDKMLAELILRSHRNLQSHRELALPFMNKWCATYCVQQSSHSHSSQAMFCCWLRTWDLSPSTLLACHSVWRLWYRSPFDWSLSALFFNFSFISYFKIGNRNSSPHIWPENFLESCLCSWVP